jgi:hypothetical protein
MRPTVPRLIFIFLVSAASTALVALDVLGLIWLVFGPGAGAAVEIAASFRGGDGAESGEREPEPAPGVGY